MEVRKQILLLLMIIVCSYAVSAATSITGFPDTISMTNCRFLNATGNISCGSTAVFMCDVQNSYVDNISLVRYTFRRGSDGVEAVYDAALYSGSVNQGTYRVQFTIPFKSGTSENPLSDTWSITAASVTAGVHVCSKIPGDPNPKDVGGCYVKFESPVQSVSCVCGLTNYQIGTCKITDTYTATLLNNPQCGTPGTTTELYCNYCDPLWVSTPNPGCVLPGTSATMTGTTTRVYYHAATSNSNEGVGCCQATNSFRENHYGPSADCKAPLDTGIPGATCYIDNWLGKGGSYDGLEKGYSVYGTPAFNKLIPESVGTNKIQPLVADMAGDGLTEVFLYQGQVGYIYRFEKTAGSGSLEVGSLARKLAVSENFYFVGQPAIIGVNKAVDWGVLPPEGNPDTGVVSYTCSNSTSYPSCGGLKIATFGGDNCTFLGQTIPICTNAYFKILNASDLSEIYSYTLPSSPDNSGITCMRRQYAGAAADGFVCWFVTQDKKLWKVTNADTVPTVTSVQM